MDMRIVERISLWHFSGKYRVAEGAPGSFFEPGSWVDVSFRGVRDAGGTAGARATPDERAAATVLQKLKLRVARKLRKRRRPASVGQMRLPFAETGEPLGAFWQARFYDFNVYSQGKKREKLNYMHANPVIRGLVKHPKDWQWSSWGFYQGGSAGFVAIDVEE
jgi:hypothetical protein